MSLSEIEIERLKLQGSFKDFTEIFYYLRTGRKFVISDPIGRESHHLMIMKELVKVLNGETTKLIINVPPRYSKTELLIHFIAWSMSRHPDSNFIYVSYSHSLAKKQTQTIKQIMQLSHYKNIMNVKLREDTHAKDNFETTAGGSVYAVGSQGTITGRGAGIQGVDRFGGIICLDDLLKPDEATSDSIREGINEWYFNTLQSRTNSPKTPIVLIGQRLHEDDICSRLMKTGEWKTIIIPAIDEAGNALNPEMHDIHTLKKMQQESPYVFSAQYQQNPVPAGGGLFKRDWFIELEEIPDIISTFITADTAETDKSYNDASVFSFWGLYKVKVRNEVIPNLYALHWLDCWELRVEPKDLEDSFMDFWSSCMRFKVSPQFAAIEKKSTGVTLLSVLKKVSGLRVLDIERAGAINSKTNRFISIQPFIANKQITLPAYGKHTKMCIDHMAKITANAAHRWDDIADTLADACKLAFIDKSIITLENDKSHYDTIAKNFASTQNKMSRLRKSAYGK